MKRFLKSRDDRTKGIFALVALAFVFASMGIFVRYLAYDFTLLQQTYLRVFAAFILGIVLFYKDLSFKKVFRIPLKDWLIIIFRAFALYMLAIPMVSQAYMDTKYSNVSFVGALPMTAVLGFILLKEKFTLQKLLYVFLGFVGVVMIAVTDYSHLFHWGTGEFLAFASSIFFSLSYIARKWQSKYLNNKETAILIFLIGTVLLITSSISLHEHSPHFSSFTGFIVFIILVAGLFNTVNLFLTNYGFEKVEAVLASNLLMLETVFAIIISIILYREVPSLKEWLGGALIVWSAYRMNKIG